MINKKFDPNFHQAMSEIENKDMTPGTIINDPSTVICLGIGS